MAAVVTEWAVRDPTAREPQVSMDSRRVLLRIDQPQGNHNGGALAFGPDRLLYVSLGDGGSGDDQGVGQQPLIGNGQDLATVLGKILRINPRGTNAPNGQYGRAPLRSLRAVSEPRWQRGLCGRLLRRNLGLRFPQPVSDVV